MSSASGRRIDFHASLKRGPTRKRSPERLLVARTGSLAMSAPTSLAVKTMSVCLRADSAAWPRSSCPESRSQAGEKAGLALDVGVLKRLACERRVVVCGHGGLLSSTALKILVVPALCARFGRPKKGS